MIYLALLYAWRKTVSRCFFRKLKFARNKGDYTKNDRLYIYIIKKV
jgi:hypothetical protein